MAKIVVVGSLITDISIYSSRLPVAGETALGQTLSFGLGGKGNNQATAASRAGAEVIMVGKIGRDSLGQTILEHYKREGMTARYITVSDRADTGAAAIEIDTLSGQNRIIVVKGANAELSREDVRAAQAELETCDAVLTQLESSLESVEEAKALALRYGRLFVLNPAPFQPIPDDLFRGVDYLTPNETEAEFFTGIPVEDASQAKKAAGRLLEMGVKNVIITLGSRGAYFYNGREELLIEPPDAKPVDTTGAGDAFNGGLTVALSEGMPVEAALRFANCVASLSIMSKGSSASMPKREQADALLKKWYQIQP